MKKTSLILGFMFVVVMLGGWSPFPQTSGWMANNNLEIQALAGTDVPKLIINNQTAQAFYLTLTGPESYSFQILPGKNTLEVAQGEYTLSYFACGVQQTKTVNVKKSGASIKLTCEVDKGKSSKAPKLTIDNKTGGPLYVTLIGPKTYSFLAPTGKTVFEVEQGTYDLSYYACGAQTTDTFLVKKKGGTLKIFCVSVIVNNLTGDPFNIALSGPAEYYFTFPIGKTTISIASGTYEFTISGPCGPDYSGTKTFQKKTTWTWYCN